MRGLTGWIFARGGSKGVHRKNLREVGGIPLLVHSIRAIQASESLARVLVSTDDPEIAEVGRQNGAEVPFLRPDRLATDTASEWDAWKHALGWLKQETGDVEPRALVSVPCTSPLRSHEDIDNCVSLLLNSEADAVVTGTDAHRNPYFNMVKLQADGFVETVIKDGTIVRRQDAPELFDLTTVAFCAEANHIESSESLYSGRVALCKVPTERSLDIDNEWDLRLANLIWKDAQRA